MLTDTPDPAVDTQDPTPEVETPVSVAEPTSWKSSLPDGYREMPCYDKFNSQEDCLKAYGDVQKIIGKKGIIKPDPNADAEEFNKYYAELGRPETPDGYGIPDVEMPEVLKEQLGDLKEYKELAHKLGYTPQQFEGIVDLHLKNQAALYQQAVQEREEQIREAETNLRRELGSTFDETIGRTKRMLQSYLGEEGMQSISQTGIGNDPQFIKGMAKLAKELGEAGITGSGNNINLTPEQAKAEIREMMTDPKSPLMDKWSPEHELAVEKYKQLQQQANPVV